MSVTTRSGACSATVRMAGQLALHPHRDRRLIGEITQCGGQAAVSEDLWPDAVNELTQLDHELLGLVMGICDASCRSRVVGQVMPGHQERGEAAVQHRNDGGQHDGVRQVAALVYWGQLRPQGQMPPRRPRAAFSHCWLLGNGQIVAPQPAVRR